MLTPDRENRWRDLCELAREHGFPRWCATKVARHLRQNDDQAATVFGASDEAFVAGLHRLMRRYPKAARPEVVVGVVVDGIDAFGYTGTADVVPIGGHPSCECDEGTVWLEQPAAIYGGELVTMAAYCPHCMNGQQRKRRAELIGAGVEPPRQERETEKGPHTPMRERILAAMSSDDPHIRRGANALISLLQTSERLQEMAVERGS